MPTIRNDFPFLVPTAGKPSLIYFDNAATTQKPSSVIQAIVDFYIHKNANPMRGIYDRSEQATIAYEQARSGVARFINAAHTEEIIFTASTTMSINMIALGWACQTLTADDEIVITTIEHHSNFLPWQKVAEQTGARLRYLKLNLDTFTIDYPGEKVINEKTKIVALAHRSNVLGSIWGSDDSILHQVIYDADKVGAKIFIDAAQSAPHRELDVQKLPVHFAAFSGHKMLGPTGIGVLYIRKELQAQIPPFMVGGGMVYSASLTTSTWQQAPHTFEAGTPPVAQAIGLHAAIKYLMAYGDQSQFCEHGAFLSRRLLDGLALIKGVSILGNVSLIRQKGQLVSFVIDGLHAHDIAQLLASNNIAVRAGNHCAQPLAVLLGINASLRVSFYLYNTVDEVDTFLIGIRDAVALLRSTQRRRV